MGEIEDKIKGAIIVLDELEKRTMLKLRNEQNTARYTQSGITATRIADYKEFLRDIQALKQYVSNLKYTPQEVNKGGIGMARGGDVSDLVTNRPSDCPFTEEELRALGNKSLLKKYGYKP